MIGIDFFWFGLFVLLNGLLLLGLAINISRLRMTRKFPTASGWLPALMQAFRQSHPVVRIELKQVNDLLASLREGVVDIAIIGEASSDRLIHYTPLVEDEMCAVLSESAELNATDYLWLDDLQGADLIYFFDLESSYLYQRYLKPNHIRLGSFQHIQDFPTLLAQVASGNGVSILPRRLLASLPEAASCKMLPIGREGYFFNWYAASRLHQFTPVTRAFLSLLQEMLV